MSKHRYILITGLMGSGKSTILREYMLNFKTMAQFTDFNRPPVEAKFQGQDFEFLDNIFGIRDRESKDIFNFYELDAPTIKRWTQFIKVADGIIIVSNLKQQKMYSDPVSLLEVILNNAPETPILFVLGNYDEYENAVIQTKDMYKTSKIKEEKLGFIGLGTGEEYFDEIYGKRVRLDNEKLKQIFEWHFSNRK